MYKRVYILLIMIVVLLSGCSSRQDADMVGEPKDVFAEKETSEQGNCTHSICGSPIQRFIIFPIFTPMQK